MNPSPEGWGMGGVGTGNQPRKANMLGSESESISSVERQQRNPCRGP